MKRTKTLSVLLLALLGAVGVATWQMPELMPWSRWTHPGQIVRSAEPPARAASGSVAAAPAASAPEQVAQGEPEQVGESADSATPLQEILPRQSEARRLGLDEVKDAMRLHSSAALVLDAKTREVLYAKNPDAVLPIASITKLMTAVVIVESKVPMDAVITVTEDDMDKERHSRSRLRVGSVLTRQEALHLALMSSENRAAHALGRTFPGGLEKFVDAMNRKAQQLGMKNTHYVDPTGLSASNHSTPRDLATLVLAASDYPLLKEYSTDSQHLVAFGNRTLQYRNSNALVRAGGWDIGLQKTGYIVEAGHCVAMLTNLHGQPVVMVLLDSDSNGRRNADAQKLRTWWNARNGFVDEPRRTAAKPEAEKKIVAKKADLKSAAPEAGTKARDAKATGTKTARAPAAKAAHAAKTAEAKPKSKAKSETHTAGSKAAADDSQAGKRVHAQFAAR